MSETQISIGKRAFKLYNKVGATERDKAQAKAMIDAEKPESLDVYGNFVYAELIFWSKTSNAYTYAQAIEIFQQIIVDKQLPKSLIVGACFFAGRMYELGLGVAYDMGTAYAHYRLANKLNPKACVKDIARLQKIQSAGKSKVKQSTPDDFQYLLIGETDKTWEYSIYMREWASEYEKCKQSLKDNRFFYPDDPEEVSLEDIDLYCVEGVTDVPGTDPPMYYDTGEYIDELNELLTEYAVDEIDDLELFDDDD